MCRNALMASLVLVTIACGRSNAADRTLDIYFLDMVGGGATLIVTPLGESVLIDTGSLHPAHRDANRILKACENAGLKQIDYLITTHFHSDHYGAILEVSQRIPVKCYMDKGALPPEPEQKSESFQELYPLYRQATKGQAQPIRAGDDIPLKNDPTGKIPKLTLHCVASEKKVEGFDGNIDASVAPFRIRPPDLSDNARSIALLLTFGRFKFLAGADITWNVEHHLVRRLGKVDLYQVTHHGLDQSNKPLLLRTLKPTVAVAMNGPRKGIQPRTFGELNDLPDLKALYQIHYNTQYGAAGNTKPEFIANPKDDPNKGLFIKASVPAQAETFTVQIGSSGQKHNYPLRPAPPDVSQCTRIEIRYYPSIRQALLINPTIFSAGELRYLDSLESCVVDDPDQIKAFAHDVSLGSYWKSNVMLATQHSADVSCYRNQEHLVSFRTYYSYICTETLDWFKYDRNAFSLHHYTPQLWPFMYRTGCSQGLHRLYHNVLRGDAPSGVEYPQPSEWCDTLVHTCRETLVKPHFVDYLRYHSTVAPNQCDYAMNPNCEPNSPGDTVLLFETKAGWNQHGGPELFTFDNHDPKGGCVLLNDGTVKFIRTNEELGALRWK